MVVVVIDSMSVKVNNLLLRLISSAESSKFIIILTNNDRDGLPLFKKFLHSTPKDDSTHLVSLEHDLKQLRIGSLKGITTHQLFGVDFDQKALNYLSSLPYGRNMFVDSLLPIVFLYGDQLMDIIYQFKLKFNRIVTLLNPDILSSIELVTLKEAADTLIMVPSSSVDKTKYTIIHKKTRSGICTSLLKISEGFSIDESGEFVITKAKEIASTKLKDDPPNTLPNLPFSLRGEEEEEASKVDLSNKAK